MEGIKWSLNCGSVHLDLTQDEVGTPFCFNAGRYCVVGLEMHKTSEHNSRETLVHEVWEI